MTTTESPRNGLWQAMEPTYLRILEHPFITGLTDGTLPAAAFARYVIQDDLYLRQYSRALALCAVRADRPGRLRMYCQHAAEAVAAEQALHTGLLEQLGIDAAEAAAQTPTPTCAAYTNFLLASCALGERHEAFAAVLPCYWIYHRVGQALVTAGSPDPRYRTWIEAYADEDFTSAVEGAIAACDEVLADLPPAAMVSAERHALTAARYEWMFWDSAWRDERWDPTER